MRSRRAVFVYCFTPVTRRVYLFFNELLPPSPLYRTCRLDYPSTIRLLNSGHFSALCSTVPVLLNTRFTYLGCVCALCVWVCSLLHMTAQSGPAVLIRLLIMYCWYVISSPTLHERCVSCVCLFVGVCCVSLELIPHLAYFVLFLFFFFFISLIADGPHYYHPACGHKGSSHLSPVHALQFFIEMQVQHSYNSSTNG